MRIAQSWEGVDSNVEPFDRQSLTSVYGLDARDQLREHFLQNNFHARLIQQAHGSLLHFPDLDFHFQQAV